MTQALSPHAIATKRWLAAARPSLEEIVPKQSDRTRMFRMLSGLVSTNSKALNCRPETVQAAVLEAMSLGLEVGQHNHGWFIPYGSELKFMLGYGGMIELMKRSGDVVKVQVELVYEKDFYRRTRKHGIEHEPNDFAEDRGEVIGGYCVLTLSTGHEQETVLKKADIEKARKSGKSGASGPWATHWEEMAKKTIIRRASKLVRMSPEAMEAVSRDDEVSGLDTQVTMTERKSGGDSVRALLEEAPVGPTGSDDPGPESDDKPVDVAPPAKKKTTRKKSANRPIRQEDVNDEELFNEPAEPAEPSPFDDL